MVKKSLGFTIVELLIVVVVIAILAAIVTVAYNGVTKNASIASAKTSLETAVKKIEIGKIESSAYSLSLESLGLGELANNGDTRLEYTSDGTTYCVTSSSIKGQADFYQSSSLNRLSTGKCPNHIGYTGGGGVFGSSSIFGASAPIGSYQVYDDGGGGLWIGSRFYTLRDAGIRVVGARVWEPPTATSAFLAQNIDAQLYTQDWQGSDLGGWDNLGSPVATTTYEGVRAAGSWTYIWFTTPVTIAKSTLSAGSKDNTTVAIKYRGGTYDGVHYVAPSPALHHDHIESSQVPQVHLAEHPSFGRSVSTVYPTSTSAVYYGLDILFQPL